MTQEQYEEICNEIANQIFSLRRVIESRVRDTNCLYQGCESIDLYRGQIRGLEYALSTLRLTVEDEDALWH